MSPSWCDNGLSEEFYILATVPLASVNRPKKDDTEHLRVHSCCWQTRSEAQLVHSCPPWPDLILTFPKQFLEPCYSWPQVWEKRWGKGFSWPPGAGPALSLILGPRAPPLPFPLPRTCFSSLSPCCSCSHSPGDPWEQKWRSIPRKHWPTPVPLLCVGPRKVACLVVMDKMGEKAPGGRREIQVELGPWACPDGKGWALEL